VPRGLIWFSVKADLILRGGKLIAKEGGEILGLGTYRELWGESPVYYLRLRYLDPDRLAELLKAKGCNVLGVHL
jgi:hypothetical protein